MACTSEVLVALNGEGTNGSTTITDSSSYARTCSVGGNAVISTAQFKFGTASMSIPNDGSTSNYIDVADVAAFDIGTGDFTIEYFARWTSAVQDQFPFDLGSITASRGFTLNPALATRIDVTANGINLQSITSLTINTGTWYHFAACRSGTSLRIYQDGTQIGTTITTSANITTNEGITIGNRGSRSAGTAMGGFIDGFRFTNDAKYTGTTLVVPTTGWCLASATNSNFLTFMGG